MLNKNYTLSNGVKIPALALGTWQVSNEAAVEAVKAAVTVGYRHIDTAVQYENEAGIGQAVSECGLERGELFLTTKIPHDMKTREGAAQTVDDSLKRMGVEYLDMVLIHAPKPWPELFAGTSKTYFEENLEVWQAMTDAYRAGKVRAIGVSNFEIQDIQNLLDHAEIKPMVNQIRAHIGHTPTEVIDFCQRNGILVEAFSPNATGKLLNHPVVSEVAEKYHVSIPQLSIRYDIQLGLLPLPRSTNAAHMAQNAELDFVISDEDMKTLSSVTEIQSLEQ